MLGNAFFLIVVEKDSKYPKTLDRLESIPFAVLIWFCFVRPTLLWNRHRKKSFSVN
jgi:hypothetical protein